MIKTISFSQVESLLNNQIDNNILLENEGEPPIAINLIGDAGIGKTSIVQELAESRGMNFIKLNLAQLDEIGDLIGYPQNEVEVQMFKLKQEGDKVTRIPIGKTWTTHAALKNVNPKQYMLTGNTRMGYAKPAWWPEYNENGTIFLLDDFTRCTPVFSQAVMDLIKDREYMTRKLPEKTTVMLTSNPDNGNYNVVGLDKAQQGRCMNYKVEFDADTWAQWAEKNKIDSRCISFALMYAKELFDSDEEGNSVADPRSFTMFCRAIKGVKDWENPDSLDFIQLISSGCFSDEKGQFGAMFSTFIAQKMHLLINPKDLLLKKWDTIADKLNEQIYKDGRYDTAVASLIERRFTNYVIAWLDSDGEHPIAVLKDRIVEFIKHNIFKQDMYYHMIQSITKVHKAQTGKLMFEPLIANKVL